MLPVALVKPLALAVSCFTPAVSMRKSENDALPLPAAVPIFFVTVPCKVPEPDEREIVRLRLQRQANRELLPN